MPITVHDPSRPSADIGIGAGCPPPVRTPLLREGGLWLKAEGGQVGHTAKYRMVHRKVSDALEAGAIGSRILTEVTSGSTGVALAYLGQRLGLPTELHVYATTPAAKLEKMRTYGAGLVIHPPTVPIGELFAAVGRGVAAGTRWHLNQYDRESTTRAYAAFAKEIAAQIRESGSPAPAVFACPLGTGGLIQGVGGKLREEFPGIALVAVEPAPDARIDGMRNTDVFHGGENDPYRKGYADRRAVVPASAERLTFAGVELGESASAVLAWVRAEGLTDVLMIAPD